MGKTVNVAEETEPVILPWTQNMSADSHRLVSTQEEDFSICQVESWSRRGLSPSRPTALIWPDGLIPRLFVLKSWQNVHKHKTFLDADGKRKCAYQLNINGCVQIQVPHLSEANYVTTPQHKGRPNSAFFHLFLEDALLLSFAALRKKENGGIAWRRSSLSWTRMAEIPVFKGKTSGDVTMKCFEGCLTDHMNFPPVA